MKLPSMPLEWPEDLLAAGRSSRELYESWATRITLPMLAALIERSLSEDVAALQGEIPC